MTNCNWEADFKSANVSDETAESWEPSAPVEAHGTRRQRDGSPDLT